MEVTVLGRIKVVTNKHLIMPVYDEQGNGFSRYLNSESLRALAGDSQVYLKKVSCLDEYGPDQMTFYQITVDVIETLLSDKVEGVVVVIEQAYLKELAFYLSLFTASYEKTIIIYSPVLEHFSQLQDFDQVEKQHQSIDLRNLQKAIEAAREQDYSKSPPLTVMNNSLEPALPDQYFRTLSLTKSTYKQKTNNRVPWKDQINGYLLEQSKSLPMISNLAKHINPMPVIPENIMIMKATSTTNEQDIMHYVQSFPGIIIEIDHLHTLSTIGQALYLLNRKQIPFIITKDNCDSSQSRGSSNNITFTNDLAVKGFSVSCLHTLDAELLLGILIAQGMSWQKIIEVVSLTNIHL